MTHFCEFCRGLAEIKKDAAQQAQYVLRAGVMTLHSGNQAEALALFNRVTEKFPGTQAHRDAVAIKNQLKRSIARELMLN